MVMKDRFFNNAMNTNNYIKYVSTRQDIWEAGPFWLVAILKYNNQANMPILDTSPVSR